MAGFHALLKKGTFLGTFYGTFFVSLVYITKGDLRVIMVQYIKLGIRVTPEQKQILETKAKTAGYSKVAFYVRSVLFRSIATEEKINAIYEKICRDK